MSPNPSVEQKLNQCLKELRLPTVKETYQHVADSATRENYSYEQFLLELMEQEREVRQHNRIQRLLKDSKLPLEKSLDQFDRSRLPNKVNQQLSTLLEGSFLDRRENILAFGNPGTGKTHLLCALAQELIQNQGRKILFTTCSLLVQQLLQAKQELTLSRILNRLNKYEAIIIDDIGYVQQTREEMEVLFTLLEHRYERGSVLITSNLPFSQWERIFKDSMTAAAAIDRLVHHCIILELNLTSYRYEHAQADQKKEEVASKKSD